MNELFLKLSRIGDPLLSNSSAKGVVRRLGLEEKTLLAALLVGVGYYLGAKIGFALTFRPHSVSVWWPPNSILLAALLLRPPREWWILFAAAFPAHWLAELQSHVPPAMILCWFISNCFEALLGAGGIVLVAGSPFRFDSLRNLATFFGFGAFLGPLVSSFVDAGFVRLNHWGEQSYWTVWRMRFFSNVLTASTIAPAIVSAGELKFSAVRALSRRRIFEAIALSLVLILVSAFVVLQLPLATGLIPVLFYAPLPILLWATVRFGPGGASSTILAVALITIWGVAHTEIPFRGKSPEENALSVQVFLTAVSVNLMALGVMLTQRRRSDDELRVTQERYREVVESQTDLVCRYLPDTTLTFANEAFCRLFGRARQELIGRKFSDFVRAEERQATVQTIQDLIRDRGTAVRENEMSLPNGRTARHLWTSYAITDSDGEVKELQAIGRDITDRKRAEEAKQNLAHVSRLAVVGELTAMIAHELNQPLGAISSNADAAEMLLERPDPPLDVIADILADIRKDDLKASQAIHRIRALLCKREMEMEPVDLNETVQDVTHLVTGDALRRHVKIRMELGPGSPRVRGDKVHLQQVLLNLLLNGMDAMHETPVEKRRLVIKTLSLNPDICEVSVEDSGHGIPPDKLTQVFDSFFTTKKDGMGLGLSIARAIIDAHQGQIWAENNSQCGATLRLILPLLPAPALTFSPGAQ